MIRKGIFAITAVLIFSFAPVTAQAQVDEEEYRAYLFTLIELLQQQIIELQKQNSDTPRLVSEIKSTKTNFESFLIDDVDDIEARYEISDFNDVAGIKNRTHRQYFDRFFDLVPDRYDDYFVDLLVFDEDLDDFDGFVETVPPYRDDTWRIGINESIFEFKITSDLIEELFVHEFAHLISYEGMRGTMEPRNNRCHEYFSEFGCPPANSYLMDFIDDFWTEDDLDALVEFEGESIWTNREVRDNFVTDYASTNPAEDFAESFTFFVLDEKNTGAKLPDQKVNYFYQFDYLIDLREEIRTEL